jgi:hypothetical protein
MFPIKHFVDETFRADVFQISHFERWVAEKGNVHLGALFGVEASLDAVVHKSHEACRHNNTVGFVS